MLKYEIETKNSITKKNPKKPELIWLTHESCDPKSWDSSIKKQNKINYKIQSPINLLLKNKIKKNIIYLKKILFQ
jgi:hypothetical protein